MKVQERNALVKVIKNRYAMLRQQAARLRNDLKRAIYDRSLDDAKQKVEAARRDMAKIEERAKKLEAEAAAVVAKHEERGIRLGKASLGRKWQDNSNELYVDESDEKVALSFTMHNEWYPLGLGDRVERELLDLERAHEMGQLALAKKETELIEEVILGGIDDTVTAQEFLAKIPTLDVLPDPKEVRQLKAAT